MNRSRVWLLCLLLLFLVGLDSKVSSQGTIKVYLVGDDTRLQSIQLVSPSEMAELNVALYDSVGDMTYYFVLNQPVMKKQGQSFQNFFYITDRMAAIEEVASLRTYVNGSQVLSLGADQWERVASSVDAKQNKPADQQPEDWSLKVMTYNIHHGRNLIGLNSLDEIAAMIRESGAEVIGLQEVDTRMPRSGLANQMKYLAQQLDMYYIYGENMNILTSQYGNGLLSKYPILSSQNLLLPSEGEQRGLLSAVVEIKGRRIHFLVTHLGLKESERELQLGSIRTYMSTLKQETVLLGDFNGTDQEAAIQSLGRHMIDTARYANRQEEPTFDLPWLSKRIDYIFLPLAYQVRSYEVISSRASDHYPVVVEMADPLSEE